MTIIKPTKLKKAKLSLTKKLHFGIIVKIMIISYKHFKDMCTEPKCLHTFKVTTIIP